MPSRRLLLVLVAAAFAAGLAVAAGCGGGHGGPGKPGLDARPSNPACVAPARPSSSAPVTLVDAFPTLPSFSGPVFLGQRPGDPTRWYLLQKDGHSFTFDDDPSVSAATTFIDLSGVVDASGEGGLLGLAWDPQFDANGALYLSYTITGDDPGTDPLESRLSRFHSSDGGTTATGPATELLQIRQPYTNHKGGNIVFGPDGDLYAGFGDGGSGGDPQGNGQNTNVLLGKMLRLDVSAQTASYDIPADNPFADGTGGRPEIYAWGFRNPWRWSFDRATGELWVGDVGQDTWEEVDVVARGGNYGWRRREGAHCYPPGSSCTAGDTLDPVIDYSHAEGKSITGGFVYRGSAIPSLVGTYLFADYVYGTIWALTWDTAGTPQKTVLVESGMNLSSFGEGADGELYVLDYGGGRIYRLAPAGAAPPATFPGRLSYTGCVDLDDATTTSPAMIPYDVSARLWSDGAEKRRWMAIPDGTTIGVGPDGDFDFPVGTGVRKEFRGDGQRVETRLLVRHDDGGWGGYSYEWNDAGTDALLLPGGKSKVLPNGQTWLFPSRAQCFACHTEAAGRTLGVEAIQLDRDLLYPETGRTANELDTLAAIGWIPASAGHGSFGRLPDPYASGASIHDRARAYLHANCSICHRPGGTGQGEADYRWQTPDAGMNVCGVEATEGDFGIPGAMILAPGDPGSSTISLRMHALDANRMPPLATQVVDTAGVAVVDAWISSRTNCP